MRAKTQLLAIDLKDSRPKSDVCVDVKSALESGGYTLDDVNETKPWGAYYRVVSEQAEQFIAEFFPGLDPSDARRGADMNPKILMTVADEILSWQYHDRRAERWACLAGPAGYYKSMTDNHGEMVRFRPGDEVQFEQNERHRLVGLSGGYALVAEIWQHTDPEHLSDEDDIVRLADKYSR